MLTSKLAGKLRRKINQFSGYVSTGLDKTARRFVGEAIYGMLCSQSVMLTEIGRTLQSTISLKKIEERFCRQLQKPGLWDCIHRQVLDDAGSRIATETLLILELSDITKKYAQTMEYWRVQSRAPQPVGGSPTGANRLRPCSLGGAVAREQDGEALRHLARKGACATHQVATYSERRCSLVTRKPGGRDGR